MILNEGQIISGRYQIIEKIGSGGMSIVYRAKDTKLDRDVTFKVLREEYVSTDEFIKRLKEEAKAVARLNHSNIVNIYDVGQDGPTNYIVMEYIDGQTLKDIIKRRAPFENLETIGVAMQIAAALSHAHESKIVHRDIKPQNVLITSTGMVKVTDFGIARTSASAHTVTLGGVTMGSVHYLSPEQARGGYVEAKSDLYSLGIVMFEIATGTLPYDGEKSVTVALKHINDSLPDMRTINPNISIAIESIIVKLTQKQMGNRYRDADELLADLREAISKPDMPVAERAREAADSPTIEISRDELTSIRKRTADLERYGTEEAFEPYGEYDNLDSYYEDADSDTDSAESGSDWKMILAGIITAFAIIIVIIIIALPRIRPLFEQQTSDTPTATQSVVVVPNLVGKDFDVAKAECEALGLKLEKVRSITDDTIPANQITFQSYNAGGVIYEGETIEVEVCAGADKYEIPNFVGEIVDDIYATSSSSPFSISVVEEYNDYVQKGAVIRQDPKSGELMPLGTPITLYESLGAKQEKVIIPDLRGKTQEEAARMLSDLGLQIGTIAQQESDVYSVGQIITQAIAAGTEVSKDETTIGIVISLGPNTVSETPSPSPSSSPTPSTSPIPSPSPTPTTANTATQAPTNTPEPTVKPIEIPVETEDPNETEEPAQTQPPIQLPPVNESVAKTLTVNHVFDPSFDGVESVSVRIMKDSSLEVYSADHNVSAFPFNLTLVDTGTVSYDIYINGIWSDTITIVYTE